LPEELLLRLLVLAEPLLLLLLLEWKGKGEKTFAEAAADFLAKFHPVTNIEVCFLPVLLAVLIPEDER